MTAFRTFVLSVSILLGLGTLKGTAEPTTLAYEGLTANLTCRNHTAEWWILPNDIIITIHQNFSRILLDDDGVHLKVLNVTREDGGTYSCAYKDGGDEVYLLKVHLEVVPAFRTGPVWEMYETNFVTGLIAAGSVLGVIFFACLVYKFRWKKPKAKKDDRLGLRPADDFGEIVAVDRL